MKRYTSKVEFYFLNGWYDTLFQHYQGYQGEPSDLVSLSRLSESCPCPLRKQTGGCTHNATYVVVKPTTGREGTVVLSNVPKIKPRSVVRVRSSWRHVRQPIAGSAQNTLVGPSMLKIVSAPREERPKAKVLPFRRPAPRMVRKSA